MTKDEFLLKVLKEAWDCCDSSEIEEGLMGAGGMTKAQVKAHYPDFFSEDDDEDDDGSKRQDAVEQVMKDVNKLLRKMLENKGTS